MIDEMSKEVVSVLMREGQLSLAGLGTFSLEKTTATVSQIEGRIKPPAAIANFNQNLRADDGRLFRHLTVNLGVDEGAARQRISDFLAEVNAHLQRGEMLRLNGVGRLFRDHTGELRFTPDQTNLNRDHYGMPEVTFSPVIRNERVSVPPSSSTVPAPSVALNTGGAEEENVLSQAWTWINANIWFIAAGTVLLFVSGLIYLQLRERPVAAESPSLDRTPPRERINVPPPPPPSASETAEPEEEVDVVSPPVPEPPVNAPPPPTDAKEALIAVGRYGRSANVDKMVRRISEAGYEPYTQVENGLTRVGVRFAYRTTGELDRALSAIRRRFTEDAFILERE